jgi:hypothetical protein
MKKYSAHGLSASFCYFRVTIRSFAGILVKLVRSTRRPAVGALCLATAVLSARAQIGTGTGTAYPAGIDVNFSFICSDPNFLSGHLINGGSANAWIVAFDVSHCTAVPVPRLTGGASIITGNNGLGATYDLTVNAWYGLLYCSLFPPHNPNNQYVWGIGYAPFYLDSSLSLGTGPTAQSYELEEQTVNSWWPGVLPFKAVPKPTGNGESAPNGNPWTISEVPGLLSISLQCPNSGGTVPNIYKGSVTAYLNDVNIPPSLTSPAHGSADTVQASLPTFTGNASLLVRSGRNYRLDIQYTTGNDPYLNTINWEIQVPNVPSTAPTDLVPPCTTTPAVGTVVTCSTDAGGGPCPWPTIVGQVGMQGETIWPGLGMTASDGPLGNSRYGTASAQAPYSFTMVNVVPSDFYSANYPDLNVPTRPYQVSGAMYFGKFSNYEYFQTPSQKNVLVDSMPCGNTNDLGNTFNMCPGHVTGNITLTGPPDGSSPCPPSAFRDLGLYSQANNDFNASGQPNSSIPGSSFFSATGPDGASAQVLFAGGPPVLGPNSSTYSGAYDIRLAGLQPATASVWSPDGLDLLFNNSSSLPAQFLSEHVIITDDTFLNQIINCGQSTQHDLNYCFGEVLVTVINNDPSHPFTSVSVSASGQDDLNNPPAYSVSCGAKGMLLPSTPAENNGQIRLFLPRGNYTLTTGVNSTKGSYNQPGFTVHVICGMCIAVTNGTPDIVLSDLPPCTNASMVSLTGEITPQNPSDAVTVSYTENGGNPVTIPYPGSAIPFAFNVPLHPCRNDIKVTVIDSTTGFSASKDRIIVQPSSAPLTINGCQDIIVNVPPTPGLPAMVSFNNVSLGSGVCPGTILSFDRPNPSLFNVGVTPVTCTAWDPCGNSNNCTFNVIVRSCATITGDTFTCTNSPDPTMESFLDTFTLSNPDPGAPAVASFVLSPDSPCFTINAPPLAAPIQPGGSVAVHAVLFVGMDCPQQLCFDLSTYDSSSNLICTTTHCFNNPSLPVITCPTNISVDCSNDFGAQVFYETPGASSLCCPPVTVQCSPPSGMFPIGITTVTCTAQDACSNFNTCTFTVTVRGHGSVAGQWVESDGVPSSGASASSARAIAVDAAGNAFVAGYFSGTVTFNSVNVLTSQGGTDAYLAKYNANGKLLWVQQGGGGGDDEALGVAVDSQGNCFVTGKFTDSASFSGNFISGFPGSGHIFVGKYDPQGNVLWLLAAGGLGPDAGEGVAVDAAGNCYVTGEFTGFATFGILPQPLSSPVSIWSLGQRDCFLAKYTSSGALEWATGSTGTGTSVADARGVAVNPAGTTAWLTGFFSGVAGASPQFGLTPSLFPTTGFGNAFVAQCDLSAVVPNWTWARQTFCPGRNNGCSSHDGRQIGADSSGNCYFTAYFGGSAAIAADNRNWFPIVPPVNEPSGNSAYNYLVGSFDSGGTPRWLLQGLGTGDDEPGALAVNAAGDVFVTGWLHGAGYFVDGGRTVNVVSYDQAGNFKLQDTAQGTSSQQVNAGRGIAVDQAGCIWVTGSFTDTNLNFSSFPTDPRLSLPSGVSESFLAKYCPACASNCVGAYFTSTPQSPEIVNCDGPSVQCPAIFTAIAGGTPPIRFFWSRNQSLLTLPNPNYTIITTGPLTDGTWKSTLTVTANLGTGDFDDGLYAVQCLNQCYDGINTTSGVGILYVSVSTGGGSHGGNGNPSSMRLHVTGPSGTPYQVQYRDDLNSTTPWQVLTNATGAGSSATLDIADPNPNPTARFYRIVPQSNP